MKTIITILVSLFTMSAFGQADLKFDIFEEMRTYRFEGSTVVPYVDTTTINTKVIDYNKPDTCYIHVFTNDTSAITVMKNTYNLKRYEGVENGYYKFYFPKSSSARIMTNLEGGKIKYKVTKVNVE